MLQPALGIAAWPAAMVVWGPGISNSEHRHHSVQLVVSLSGSLLIRGGREKRWRKCEAVFVRPDALHEMDARGSAVLIGFIDAESEIGAALSERIAGEIACVPPRVVARWRRVLGPTPNQARVAG